MTATPAAMPGAKPPAPRETPAEIPPSPFSVARQPLDIADVPVPAQDQRRHVPLYGVQYIRREAVRLAIESYSDTDRPDDAQLLATADLIAEFIRNGKTP